jgi:hypothetical protein
MSALSDEDDSMMRLVYIWYSVFRFSHVPLSVIAVMLRTMAMLNFIVEQISYFYLSLECHNLNLVVCLNQFWHPIASQ